MDQSAYDDALRVTPEKIADAVRVIVEQAAPRRVVLFGSAARGSVSEARDVDLMVVVDDEVDRRSLAGALHRALFDAGVSVPVDLVVVTEAGFDRHRDTAGLVYREIAREGRQVYGAA